MQDPVDDVAVAQVAGREQQPVGEHDGGDAGAGLGVGAVRRQHEVVAERLVEVAGAHAAGDVRPAGERAVELPDDGGEQLVVAGLDGHVDGAGGQVERADGVPVEHLAVADRHGVLEVPPPELVLGQAAVPAPGHEPGRLVEVALLAGDPEQLHERRLDLRVAADAADRRPAPKVSQMWSAARRATSSRPAARPVRAAAVPAWIRWPAQYSSWPKLRSL